MIDTLGRPRYVSTLDLRSGYWQISLHPDSREKTGFTTHAGNFEFLRMSFGHINSGSAFNRMMRVVLKDMRRYGVVVNFDDIILAHETWEEHLTGLRYVFQCLAEAGLTSRLDKCTFAQAEAKVLGHIIDKNGIRIDPAKLQGVENYPRHRM